MKRISLLTLLILLCSLPGYSQFWIEFNWNVPSSGCHECSWMIQSMHLSPRQANDYHKVVHKYGKRIEKEARRDYRYWDKSAARIYDLRLDRDRQLQRILSPQQFGMYVRFTREHPGRIHDYRGWYENPHYRGRAISSDWRRYENGYWSHWDNHHNNNQNYNNSKKPNQNNNGYNKPNNNSRPNNNKPGNNNSGKQDKSNKPDRSKKQQDREQPNNGRERR